MRFGWRFVYLNPFVVFNQVRILLRLKQEKFQWISERSSKKFIYVQ